MIMFKKDVGVDSKEEEADMEDDPFKEEIEYINLDDERERHWRMIFKENDGGVDDKKALIHTKR